MTRPDRTDRASTEFPAILQTDEDRAEMMRRFQAARMAQEMSHYEPRTRINWYGVFTLAVVMITLAAFGAIVWAVVAR